MPKRVGHRERRAQIADALMRVAAEQGLDEVSLRHVAAEARVSAGMVQHYFRTKDEMMLFAMGRIAENVTGRLARDGSLRALLLQMLPLDEERRTEVQVSLAFVSYAMVRPSLGAGLRGQAGRLRTHVAGRIRDAGIATDPDLAAVTLLALVDGLAIHVLGGHCSGDHAVTALDTHLRGLFGPPGIS